MDFIGRHRELADLQSQYESNHAFVVVYGRRRIEKTGLKDALLKIKEFLG